MANTPKKGFITDANGNTLLPITRAELVLDIDGKIALHSQNFLANSNRPGLLSQTHYDLLNTLFGEGSESSGSLSDIYLKLKYINEGIKVGNTALSFYGDTGATPITFEDSETIAPGTSNNYISFNLKELAEYNLAEKGQIIKSINVDKYGRVINVSQDPLTNDELPTEISYKKLYSCTTDTIPVDSNSIVNKQYVDEQFNSALGIANGALKFSGQINDADIASSYLISDNINNYYKVTGNFILPSGTVEGSNVDTSVKSGDTLIVYRTDDNIHKYIHIPSGDDLSTVSVWNNSSAKLTNSINTVLNFTDIFTVATTDNVANIGIPEVSQNNPGYLSAEDYISFKSYADKGAVTFTPNITKYAPYIYTIGTFKVGETPAIVQGHDTTYTLTSTDEDSPNLVFTETGKEIKSTSIQIKGGNAGINVKGNGTSISITPNVTPVDSYITVIDGYKIRANVDKKNGLVSYDTYNIFANNVLTVLSGTLYFTEIENKLSDQTGTYIYGSKSLKSAINADII